MCLAVPGKVVRWIDRDPTFATAELEFDGIRRVCHMACATVARVGDYVFVHAGLTISLLDPEEANRLLADLSRLSGYEDEFRTEIPP